MKADLQRHGHEVFAFECDLPLGSPIWRKVASAIESSDYVLVFLSPGARLSKGVARELHLALRLQRQRGTRPVIVGVRMGERWPRFVRPRNFDSGRLLSPYSFTDARSYDPSFDKVSDLSEQLSIKVSFITAPEGSHRELFLSSLECYKQLFPREERDPPEAIMQWLRLNASAEEDGSPWRDLWAVVHTAGTILGFAFFTLHVKSHWCFANYFGILQCWRQDSRAVTFLQECKKRLLEIDPQCHGFVFEVDPLESRAPELSDSALRRAISRRAPIVQRLRAAKRLLLYSRFGVRMLKRGDSPVPYWQPPLTPPLRKQRNVSLHLLAKLFKETGEIEPTALAAGAVDFVYDDLYGEAYAGDDGAAIKGFRPYVSRLKRHVQRPFENYPCEFRPFLVPRTWQKLLFRAERISSHSEMSL